MPPAWLAVVIAAVPTSTTAGEWTERSVEVRADRLEASPTTYRAEGRVVVRLEGAHQRSRLDRMELRADAVTLERAARRLTARGQVRIRHPDGTLTGETATLVWAEDGPRLRLTDATFTLCECAETPSWAIGARSAEVVLGEDVTLTWPTLYIEGVPVMALPWGYWPLAARRSGLMIPSVRNHPAAGLEVGLPVYIVLGRSWDATLTPMVRTHRGVGGQVEVRNHPASGVRGQLSVWGAYDQGQRDGDGWRWATAGRGRFRLEAVQGARLGSNTALAADVDLASDPAVNEFADVWVDRQAEFSRSRVTVRHRSDRLRFAGGIQWLQDFRPSTYDGGRPSLWTDPRARAVRQRAVELRFDVLPTPLGAGDGLWGDVRASVQGFGAIDPSIPAFARADLRPTLQGRVPLPFGLVASGSARVRATGWFGDERRARVAPILAAALRQDLGRAYGAWLHRIRSEVQALWVIQRWGRSPVAYSNLDEIDALERVAQLRLRLATDLERGEDTVYAVATTGYDFSPPGDDRPGRGWAPIGLDGGLRLRAGPWSTRWEVSSSLSVAGALVAVGGGAMVEGPSVLAGVRALHFGSEPPPDRFVAPEALVPGPALAAQRDDLPWRPQTALQVWTRLRPWRVLSLFGRLAMSFETDEVVEAAYPRGLDLKFFRSAVAGGTYISSCRCWSLTMDAGVGRDQGGVRVGVQLTVGRVEVKP